MLCVTSPFEKPMSARVQSVVWKNFLAGGSNHSAQASTLPYIIRRCEQERIQYVLHALPGKGYRIEKAATSGQG